MTQSSWSWIRQASWLAIAGAIIASSGDCVFAQSRIIPDETLGAESSQVIPNAGSLPVEVIDGGAQRGANLFHSFSEFNVSEGRGAYFTNPTGIENILSRVTGGNASNILGTLGVLGNANLFLINPNGIIFGPNARLDVKSSFVGTTANSVWLGDTGLFSASQPATSNLLSVKPSALFFNALATQEIVNRSTATITVLGLPTLVGLQVPDGQSLLLVGGDVKLEGGRLTALGGHVELGGLASSGTVGLNVDGNHPRLSFPDEAARADVSLTNNAVVNVIAGGGGSIAINAQKLDILEGSTLLSGSLINLGSVSNQAGNVEINATDQITISGVSDIANLSFPPFLDFLGNTNLANIRFSGIVNLGSGNIVINTGSLNLSKGVIASTELFGNSGNIQVNATNSVSVNGRSILGTSNGLGQGDSGDITVKAGDTISFEGQSIAVSVGGTLSSLFSGDSKGKAGEITIEARSLILRNGSFFTSGTVGRGDAGNITVKASDSISLDNSFISSSVGTPSSEGNAAEINIQTQILSLTNGAVISSLTSGIGSAGKINVNASDSVNISGVSESAVDSSILNILGIDSSDIFGFEADLPGYSSGIFTGTETAASGQGGEVRVTTDSLRIADGGVVSARTRNSADGGNIFINANTLEATGGGQILTTAFSSGHAGNIVVEATDSVILSGSDRTFFSRLAQFGPQIVDPDGPASGLFANTRGAGAAGSIALTAPRITTRSGAQIAATTRGGAGGSITITGNSLEATEGGQVLTTTSRINDAGDINFLIQDRLLLSGTDSGVFANTTKGSSGNGGSIFIDPQTVVIQDEAKIAVDSRGTGTGGDITLEAGNLTLDNEASISAETVNNTGGNISLEVQNFLLLLQNSQITATAGTDRAGGDGGNIDIAAQFIAATQNSDITANAFAGKGGNININAFSVFGLAQSDSPTDATSDITASSELGLEGTVEIDTPEVDPSRGLVELPTVLIETEVVQACAPSDTEAQSEFIITGRGGLPPTPREVLTLDPIEVDWSSLNPDETSSSPIVSINPDSSPPNQIVEAQGWTVDNNGEVWFVASASTPPPRSSWQNSSQCYED